MQNVINKRVINVTLKLQVYTTNRLRIIGLLTLCHYLKPLYFVKCPRAMVKKNEDKNNLIKEKIILKVN